MNRDDRMGFYVEATHECMIGKEDEAWTALGPAGIKDIVSEDTYRAVIALSANPHAIWYFERLRFDVADKAREAARILRAAKKIAPIDGRALFRVVKFREILLTTVDFSEPLILSEGT